MWCCVAQVLDVAAEAEGRRLSRQGQGYKLKHNAKIVCIHIEIEP